MPHATIEKGASAELLALKPLVHQDVTYEVQAPSPPGGRRPDPVHVGGDAIGSVQSQRAAPVVSTVVMDRRIDHVQEA